MPPSGGSPTENPIGTPTSTPPAGGCTSDFACRSDEFCYRSKCEPVLGRRYQLAVLSASVGTSKPNGTGWDFGGGAPDLFAVFGVDGGDDCATFTVFDSFSATWNQQCKFVFKAGDTVYVNVWDEDVSAHDAVGGFYWQGNDGLVALARAHGTNITLRDGSFSLVVRLTPDF